MMFLIFWIIGLVVGVITTIINASLRDIISISNNLLFYQLAITISLTGIMSFIGHVFKSDVVADSIGWQKGSMFQKELGFTELGFGIAGILCIWFKGYFWLATIIIITPLFIGAAYVHIKEIIGKENFKSGNSMTIMPDILIPLTLIVLSITGNIWK